MDFLNKSEKLKKLENLIIRADGEKLTIGGVPVEFINDICNQFDKYSFVVTTYTNESILRYFDSIEEFKLDEIGYSAIIRLLSKFNYSRSERVFEKGEFSVKGDIVTFWPRLYEYPIRIEFFGEDAEQAEIYDASINLKVKDLNHLLIPNESFLENENFPISLVNPELEFKNILLFFNQYSLKVDLDFELKQPRLFFQRFDLVDDYIKSFVEKGFSIIISSKHPAKIPDRLSKFLDQKAEYPSGIISLESKILVLTDRELFGTIFLDSEISRNTNSTESRKMLAQFEGEVEIGDYVVHEDHGIAIYGGIIQESSSNEKEEFNNYIKLTYAEDDELLVPLNLVYKITKYISSDGVKPNLTRLGKGEWNALKTRVKLSVQIMASELVSHYAKISLAKAKVIVEKDSKEYLEFSKRFEYKETPDQLRSIAEIAKDLSLEKPMNRLIVGDVGFGKTEVIMRAAFKVIETGKQVVILCPTTVLAAQHYKVFTKRFKDFPFTVGILSRFKTKFENKETVEKLKEGKVDIIIGTHRLLSNDIEFKDLGMVIVDEEQKFGVKQKEKLRKLEYGVHLLMTTATPIPRTLSMALSSIQDISTIQTPPEGRKSVKTHVEKLEWNEIVSAINHELKRDGQVYIIYNNVETIFSIASKLTKLVPGAKFAVAHGQMQSDQLEKIMIDFINKKYNCLVCTTIIENGIDISNVNTLIVLKAQNFGLSQLHQIRGRVGRGKEQAYAYFFYEGNELDKEEVDEEGEKVTKDYIRRLAALKEHQELGAGFDISTKDLEIRGAGNLLGREQHGNIDKIGFGLYMQMLSQEIEKQKNLATK